MKKEQKFEIVEQLSEKFAQSPNFYLADISELSVAQITQFRKLCYSRGVELKVAKNTFIKKALLKANINNEELFSALHGPSSIMFSENSKVPAQLIKDFRKKNVKPAFKAAFVEESVYLGEQNLEQLINLKSKEELIGEVLTILQSPIKNLVSALNSGGNQIMGVLETMSNK